MSASEFLAEAVATREWCGVGVGSDVEEWDARIRDVHFVDVGRRVERGLFRRDYGLVEVLFAGGEPWVCDSFTVQLHRMAYRPAMMAEWLADRPEEVPAVTWDEMRRALDLRADASVWTEGRQHDMLQYMSDDLGVSVFVLGEEDEDDEQEDGQRDDAEVGTGPGPGDVWSIVVGPIGQGGCGVSD